MEEAVDRHGPDALRYFVLREVPVGFGDGNFTWERFDERYTSDLANDLGNLANRTLSMIGRYRDGTVPTGGGTSLDDMIPETLAAYAVRMDASRLHEGAAAAFDLVSAANGFVEARAPWKLAKNPAQSSALDETLHALAHALAAISVMLSPFMPGKPRRSGSACGARACPCPPSTMPPGWTPPAGRSPAARFSSPARSWLPADNDRRAAFCLAPAFCHIPVAGSAGGRDAPTRTAPTG
jgi:methionyl-tRNA synthetase